MMTQIERISEWANVPRNVLLVIIAIFIVLVIGTIARLVHLPKLTDDKRHALVLRLRTWWMITLVLAAFVILGRMATLALICLVSVLALWEYLSLMPQRAQFSRIAWWMYAAAILQYVWIYLDYFTLSIVFIPALTFLLLTLRLVMMRRPEGFVNLAGSVQWGMMLLVFCLSHAAMLFMLPRDAIPAGGAIGLFVFLVFLTEFNDIMQAVWGRPFGRHKIIPAISPQKSWEGLIGGVICTVVLAILLAPVLTPLADTPALLANTVPEIPFYLSPWSIVAGLFISIGGFFGDLVISALKRDVHVKDSGTLLPGQGGILDRVDSLSFTAPLFFYYVYFLYCS